MPSQPLPGAVRAALLDAYQDWFCPNCGLEDRTRPLPPNASRFHTCSRLHSLSSPLIRAGTDCKVTAVEREDYQRAEVTHPAEGTRKVFMAVRTDRGDGSNDLAVLAPCATALGG